MDFTFSSDQMGLRQKARDFAEKEIAPLAEELDAAYDYHSGGVNRIKRSGFYAYVVPEPYGGKGISSVNLCIVREEFAKISTFADEVFIMQDLGSNPIVLFGNEKQKAKYLPPLLDGSRMANFCLTERSSGSDVAGIQATARLEGDFYVLNGRKCYVSRPGYTDISVVFAKTNPGAGGGPDDPIPEIAVALNVPLAKLGAPRTGERISKQNCLLRIEEELGELGQFSGPHIFKTQ